MNVTMRRTVQRAPLRRLLPALALLGAPVSAGATPLISEVLYDAAGSDDGKVFVELWGAPGTLLDGLVLEGVNGAGGATGPSVALSGVIPADGLFVLADESGGVPSVAGAEQVASFDFQNGPDSVVLRDGATVLDALGYGSFGPGDVFAGEGTPAPDAPSGASLARRFADVDTDDNGADFVVLDAPTPGAAPRLHTVPEPRLAVAWVAGAASLGALAGSGRRRR